MCNTTTIFCIGSVVFLCFAALLAFLILYILKLKKKLAIQSLHLLEKDKGYRSILDGTPNTIMLFDQQGCFLRINKNGLKLVGMEESYLLGRRFSEIWPPDTIALVDGAIAKVLHGEQVSFEADYIRPDGGVITWWVMLFSVGEQGFMAISTDTSKRKKAEEALRESEEKYRLLIEESSDPIFSFNRDGRYLFANKAFANGVGMPQEFIVGNTIWDVFSKDEADKRFSVVRYVFETGEPKVIEVRVPTPSGDTFFITSVIPVKPEPHEVKMVICISKNITERRKAEDALKVSEQSLRKAKEAQDKLFSIIAHDLRGPFSCIIGLSELLSENMAALDIAQSQEYLRVIQSSAKNTMNLLENLLSWAKSQTGQVAFKPQQVELLAIFKEMEDVFQVGLKIKNVDLVFLPVQSIYVYADVEMLKTILRNLISNALKFSYVGGQILVSAQEVDGMLEIGVADSGVGLSDDVKQRLFEIDPSINTLGTLGEKGSGLGLVLCKEFVERNGGRIYNESLSCRGCCLKFTVPLRKNET